MAISKDDLKAYRRAGVSADRAKHGGLELVKDRQPRARVVSAIERYQTQGKIDALQCQAAQTLYADWARSGLDPWASGMDDGSRSAPGSKSPGCGPRYVEYCKAMRALPPLHRSVVRYVVIEDMELSKVAADQVSNKTLWALLRTGLDILAKHYRLA